MAGAWGPQKAKPVSLRRKLHATLGMVEENREWLAYLTDGYGKKCVGRDPMTIPVNILSAAGHPPRRTSSLVAAFNRGTGGENNGLDGVKRFSDIRGWCLACTDNIAETRRCSTIHCPFWPYRMGRNPHNPQRGINPFKPRPANGT